jgi:peptidoglycan/xylan/chitin deacetylase (PgdA/CDA1 family)
MIIINYHNVIAHAPNAFNLLARKEWILIEDFRRQVAQLARRYDIVPLDDIVVAVRDGRELANACAITFDDGNWGGYAHAAPVLEELGMSAAFLVATALLREADEPRHDYFDRLEALLQCTEARSVDLSAQGLGAWPLDCDACKLVFLKSYRSQVKVMPIAEKARADAELERQLAVPEERIARYLDHEAYRMMRWQDVLDLGRRGFTIGSHSRTHASLPQVDGGQLEDEVCGSLRDLRERLGERDFVFAYPFGGDEHISDEVVDAVQRAGYTAALVGESGPTGNDPFRLRRQSFRGLKKLDQVFA